MLVKFVGIRSNSFEYRVLEGLNNALTGDTILLAPSDGASCIADPLPFDTLLYALQPYFSSGTTPYDYVAHECGITYGIYQRDSLHYQMRPGQPVMAYADFKADFLSCLAMPQYVPGTGKMVHWKDTLQGLADLIFQLDTFPMVTDELGYFEFPYIPLRQPDGEDPDYLLQPQGGNFELQQITTADLVATQKHILGLQHFTRPEQYLAADLNGSHSVSVLDVLLLRRLILHIDNEPPTAQSRYFIPLDYVFPDARNPWQEEFPESILIQYYYDELGQVGYRRQQLDFRVVQTGDVNGA